MLLLAAVASSLTQAASEVPSRSRAPGRLTSATRRALQDLRSILLVFAIPYEPDALRLEWRAWHGPCLGPLAGGNHHASMGTHLLRPGADRRNGRADRPRGCCGEHRVDPVRRFPGSDGG